MEWYNYIGIIAGLASLFFGFCAFFLYLKVKKLISLLTEEQLKDAMKKLSEREKKIIDMRYYIGKTQSEIAKEIGISQAQVSRLEKSALERLKKQI